MLRGKGVATIGFDALAALVPIIVGPLTVRVVCVGYARRSEATLAARLLGGRVGS